MDFEAENIELFDDYLNREMDQSAIELFEARLSYDSDFLNQFKSYQEIGKSVKQHFRNEMKTKFNVLDRKLGEQKSKKSSSKWIWLSGAAAAVLLIGFIVFSKEENVSQQLVAEYWPYEEGLPVKMSNKGKYDEAMNAFKLEDWHRAEELLLKIDSDTASYFLGVVAYEEKDFKQALGYFKEVDAVSAYYDEAQFRLALIFILIGDIEESKLILQLLIDHKTVFAIESEKLLSDLKKK